MKRNEMPFVSIVERKQVTPLSWDPYFYRNHETGEILGKYVTIVEPARRKGIVSHFLPIEYRDITKDVYSTFILRFAKEETTCLWPIGEEELLFGTLRAYLGNVLVTPKAEWLGLSTPIFFPIKSEFLRVVPKDSYLYFWWAYLRSSGFLGNLPLGGGGTRPRLHQESLLLTPVTVPSADKRRTIHQDLKEYAEREWRQYVRKAEILGSLNPIENENARDFSRRTRRAET